MRTDAQAQQESTQPLNATAHKGVFRLGKRKSPAAQSRVSLRMRRWVRLAVTVLLVLVILAILAVVVYFVKVLINSKFFFCSKSFKFIPISEACDGKADCSDGEDEQNCVTHLTVSHPFPVRMVSDGSILQLHNNVTGWRTICSEGWTQQHTQLACQQLGYTTNPRAILVPVQSLPASVSNPFGAVLTGLAQVTLDTVQQTSCNSGSAVSLVCSDCGNRTAHDRIVGGTDATIENWPWQVSLQYLGSHTCGGSLVSTRWVIAAAHCFTSYREVSRWQVMMGSTYMTTVGTWSVDKIFVNGQYDPETSDYDIAMLRLAAPFTPGRTRLPVCLPPTNLNLQGQIYLMVTGWGYQQENGQVANTLQKASVPLIPQATCASDGVYGSAITPRMLCAGYMEGKVDACQGDSGGPLVYMVDQWDLIGVVSWGMGCAEKGRPGVYSNVGSMLDWVYSVMQGNQ